MMIDFNSNYNYYEMSRLFSLLCDAGIPCEIRPCYDGLQLCYPSIKNCVCDAILHSGSYGHEKGLLEIMGLVDEAEIGDSVQGWMTADEVFSKIANHFKGE